MQGKNKLLFYYIALFIVEDRTNYHVNTQELQKVRETIKRF